MGGECGGGREQDEWAVWTGGRQIPVTRLPRRVFADNAVNNQEYYSGVLMHLWYEGLYQAEAETSILQFPIHCLL